MKYKVYTGFLLKRTAYREADEIVTFWSWEEGKVRLLVRGLKKSTSRLKSILTPVALLQLQAVGSEFLPVVSGVKALKIYSSLISDLSRIAAVFNLFEMILRSTGDGQANVNISILTRTGLDYLDQNPPNKEFLTAFRLRLLSALGYSPISSVCAQCGKNISVKKRMFWSNLFVGMICSVCSEFDLNAKLLDLPIVGYLDRLKKESFSFNLLAVGERTKLGAEKLLIDAFQAVCERELNSKNFLMTNLSS